MAVVPRMLRPSVLLRRKAMYQGFLGNSGFWKVVGVVLFGKSTIKKFFGKRPEVVDTARLGPGHLMQLTTSKPQTVRSRRRMTRRGVTPPTLADDQALGRLWVAPKSRQRS